MTPRTRTHFRASDAPRFLTPLGVLGGLLVLYLAFPLGAFVVRFVSARQRGFSTPGLFPSLWMSVSCATISLGLITVLGVPLAFVLARSTSRTSQVVGVLVQVPLALPPLMSGIVLIYVIGPYTLLGRTFHRELTNSRIGIIIAMTFVAAPFLIVAARAAFATLDQGLLDVAHTLGHSEASRFLRVAVPLAGPSIRAGMLLTWLRAFGEYGAVVVLAYNPTSLPIFTYNQFSGVGLSTTLAPTALAMGVAVAAVVISRASFPSRRHRRITVAPSDQPVSLGRGDDTPQSIAFHSLADLGSFHLDLAHGDVRHLAVLGPSGSGKSLLLRSLAGLTNSRGDLSCNGESLTAVRIADRPVGYVAQGFSLFPHLTVWQQLLFARHATAAVATYWSGQLQLRGLEDRFPNELSGGQRQRVALAQALCNSPRVLLLDEPFSALDSPVRHELRRVLRRLQHDTGVATVLVTHDPEEAALLARELIVVSDGHQLQAGTVADIFNRPSSPVVARLLGMTNVFAAVVIAADTIEIGTTALRVDTALTPGTHVTCAVRPELVTLRRPGDAGDADRPTWRGTVTDVADLGTATIVFVDVGEIELQSRSRDAIDLLVGEQCVVEFAAGSLSLWPVSRGTNATDPREVPA